MPGKWSPAASLAGKEEHGYWGALPVPDTVTVLDASPHLLYTKPVFFPLYLADSCHKLLYGPFSPARLAHLLCPAPDFHLLGPRCRGGCWEEKCLQKELLLPWIRAQASLRRLYPRATFSVSPGPEPTGCFWTHAKAREHLLGMKLEGCIEGFREQEKRGWILESWLDHEPWARPQQ